MQYTINMRPLVFFILIEKTICSNWAQTTGDTAQNTVISTVPSATNPHWEPRYGMSVTHTLNVSIDLIGVIYLLGGDTYNLGNAQNIISGQNDLSWSKGYKNDVWSSNGISWLVKGDIRLQNGFDQKLPRVRSTMKWKLLQKGLMPQPGTTYEQWLKNWQFCQLPQNKLTNPNCYGDTATWNQPIMWSPRRHHVSCTFNNLIWVMGGRAREIVEFSEDRSIGGITSPRVKDIPLTFANHNQRFTTQREASVYKSDVWSSPDGIIWTLVTPGCKNPQKDVIAVGNPHQGKHGSVAAKCKTDKDCYSTAERCNEFFTCECQMWTPREQHAVAVYGNYMYISGGYTSQQLSDCGDHPCGDTDASSYRFYLQDVWRTSDGITWTQIIQSNSYPARGGHSMLVVPDTFGKNISLWIIGGRGGDPHTTTDYMYNDIWTSSIIAHNPSKWTQLNMSIPWVGRTGHVTILITKSASNKNTRQLIIIGGQDVGGNILDDVWAWRLDQKGDFWRKDYDPHGLFASGSGAQYRYMNNSPAVHYITPDSNLSYMQRWWSPTKSDGVVGKRYELRIIMTDKKINQLASVGIYTVRQLANADKYTILKMRGFDYPQIPDTKRYDFYDICDMRAIATAIVNKCSVTKEKFYDGERNMPWNIDPIFGGAPPVAPGAWWHGKNYSAVTVDTDPIALVNNWDGCSSLPPTIPFPNVNGIGKVPVLKSVKDPTPIVQNLFCKFNQGKRAFHAGLYFQELVFVFGGKQSDTVFYGDSWYRDARLPSADFAMFPRTVSPDSAFKFEADEAGVTYEYRVWDAYNYKEIRPWVPVTFKTDVAWLNWRASQIQVKGGPGYGKFTMYLRAVDPAGNRDERFILGRNMYTWVYISPLPWDIIIGCIFAFLFLLSLSYFEYRRRVKKAAMERFAMKRMRRKFKAMQIDKEGKQVDWRTLYDEHKQAGKDRRKDRKKKSLERETKKREEEKKKRDKEKNDIKKKLKARKAAKLDNKEQRDKEQEKADRKAKKEARQEKIKKQRDVEEAGELAEFGDIESGTKKRNKKYKEYEEADMAASGGPVEIQEVRKQKEKKEKVKKEE